MKSNTKFKETEIGLIPEEWGVFRLADLTEKVIDNRGKTPPLSLAGFELLEVNAVKKGNRIPDYSEVEKFVDDATYNSWFRGGHIKIGDIIIPTVGTIGNIAISLEDRGSIAQNLIGLRLNGRVEPSFIYYLLSSLEYKERILNLDIGGVQPSIKVPHLLNLEVAIPESIAEQKQIAEILSSLDDKIELNRKINANLEKLASALFKKWFVDIGDELPEGWEVRKIGDVVAVKGGSTPSTSRSEYWQGGSIPWATPRDLSNLKSIVLLDTEKKITESGLAEISSALLPEKTILLSSRAPIGYVAIASIPVAINQGFIAINADETMFGYILFWVKNNIDLIESRANGSTFLEINKANFRDIEMVVPDVSLLNKFRDVVNPLVEAIIKNEHEISNLEKVRDSLLPRLMSGKIRVKI